MYKMNPPDDEHNVARNMKSNVINVIKKWCIKLEHEIKYYQNARSKHIKSLKRDWNLTLRLPALSCGGRAGEIMNA